MYKKVIIKISGEGLAGDKISGRHFDDKTVNRIVAEIKALVAQGVEASIVVGGGNFWRGAEAKPEMDKTKAHQIGMMGTVMNGIYLAEHFRMAGVPSVVMTPFDLNGFTQRFTKEIALEAMANRRVVIFAGGTGHPFFSTDSIVAIRACELNVDAVLYAKSVDSVYNADPKKADKSGLRRYKTVSYQTVVANNLNVADISAINLTAGENIDSVVFSLLKEGSIIAAAQGEEEALFQIGGTKVANGIEEEYYV